MLEEKEIQLKQKQKLRIVCETDIERRPRLEGQQLRNRANQLKKKQEINNHSAKALKDCDPLESSFGNFTHNQTKYILD